MKRSKFATTVVTATLTFAGVVIGPAAAHGAAPQGVDTRTPTTTAFSNCPAGPLQPGGFDGSLTVTVTGTPTDRHTPRPALNAFPTGTVDFEVVSGPDHVGSLGTPTLVSGSASSDAIDFDEPGEYLISASYSGDLNYRPSNDSCTVDVLTADSLTVSSSSPINGGTGNPTSQFGDPVTFTVTYTVAAQPEQNARARTNDATPSVPAICEQPVVKPAQTAGSTCAELEVDNYPTNGEDFFGGVELTFDHTDGDGNDVFTGSQEFDDLPLGSHYVEADLFNQTFGNFALGSHDLQPDCCSPNLEDDLIQDVVSGSTPNKRPTKTVLTSSANPSDPGAPVTFTAVVTPADGGSGTPTGTVNFGVDGVNHPVTLSGGTATFDADNLTAGAHPVTAMYTGDIIFSPSSDTLTQQVGTGTATLHGLMFTAPGTSALGLITVDGASTPVPIRTGSLPTSLAIGKDGRVWVTEAGKNAIAAVDAAGHETDYALAQDAAPTSIAAGSDGRLWFTEPTLHRIGAITTAGAISTYRIGHADPTEITAGPNGRLWFTEPNRSKVGRIRTNGHHKTFSVRAGSRPFGIATGPDGAIWFTEQAKRRIGRITTHGDVSDFKVDHGSRPSSIVTGPDGKLWFTEPGRSKIGRISTAGDATSFSSRAGGQPSSIVVGPDHRLWFTEPSISRIGTMTQAGTFIDYSVAAGSAPSAIISLS